MNSENTNDCCRQGHNLQIPRRNRKPRLKWSKELHQHFVRAVNRLGGAHEATPRNILKLMGLQQITSNHIKSHLQKYRHSKDAYKIASIKAAKDGITMMPYEVNQERTHERHTHKWKDSWACKARNSIEGHSKFQKEREGVQYCQGENVSAVPEWILETTNGQDTNSEQVKSEKNKLPAPITYQTQIHSLCSCLTFCNLTQENQETGAVDAEADSGTQLSLGGIENKNNHERENTWFAAITKHRPLCSSFTGIDWNVEEVEAQQRLANASKASVGFQVKKSNTRSIFLEGRTRTISECYSNLHDLDSFSVQSGSVGAPDISKLSLSNENGLLRSSRESNSSNQLFDLNISVPDEH